MGIMNAGPENSIVRFFGSDGTAIGAGFLVAEMTVITCAHVVTAALDLKGYTSEMPTVSVSLDFPLIASEQVFSAQVVFWQPPQLDDGGDIAMLYLDCMPPTTAKIARLVVTDDLWGHDFRAFGFPSYHENGVWASGKLRAPEATGWIMIEDVKETGFRVQPGFSGGPVWDEQLNGVVGMVVAAEDDSSIKAAYIIPVNALIEASPHLKQRAVPQCPYRGLFAFREQDEQFFFGREVFTKQMVDAIHRNSLLAVVGPSGSGKSSVVFAGLLPHLRREKGWLIASLRPGNRPFHSLAAALIPLIRPMWNEIDILAEIGKLSRQFQNGDVLLQDVIEMIIEKNDGLRLLLVIDQFEELYTLSQESETRQHFLDDLLATVKAFSKSGTVGLPRFTLVLTLRADFIGQALSYRPFADALQYTDLKLGPMNLNELRDAMRKPASKFQVSMEEGLAERILDDVHESTHLPLLEFALTLLWEKQQNNKLTHAAYEEIGGVEQALADHAEAVYAALDEKDQLRAQQILLMLVRPGEGTQDTRRLATSNELGGDNWELVIRLANARLIVTDHNEITGEETVEVVHEALIQRWKRIRTWVNADRAFLAWRERLRTALNLWQESQQDEGLLLRGASLVEAKFWLERRCLELNS
jgi:hypothetical protein